MSAMAHAWNEHHCPAQQQSYQNTSIMDQVKQTLHL